MRPYQWEPFPPIRPPRDPFYIRWGLPFLVPIAAIAILEMFGY